jgi:DNA polymerase III delta subunit
MESIIYTPIQVNAFAVLDALAAWDTKNILKNIDASAQSQTARPEFIGMLYRGIKHMLQTVYLYNSGTRQAKDIASAIGMHFFPIVKNLKSIDYLSKHKTQLQNMFHELLLLDKDIKSWMFPAEWFRAAIQGIVTKI